MPKRTDEETALMAETDQRQPDRLCNARVIKYDGSGNPNIEYCGKTAGWGTDHVGTGRCRLHGGASGGAPIVSGLYSKQLNSTLAKEVDRIANDPNFLTLYDELALAKAAFANLMSKLETKMDGDEDFWTMERVTTTSTERIISPEANLMMKMMETMGKIIERIVAAETKMENTLTIRGIQMILQQIKHNINENCGVCPIREQLKAGLDNIKVQSKESKDGTN